MLIAWVFFKSATTKILNLLPGAGTRSHLQFDLREFEEKVFIPFLDALTAEVKEIFNQFDFWFSFVVFDLRRLPDDQNLLVSYDEDEMEKLLSHYEKDHTDIYKGETLSQSADLVTDAVLAEWASFKEIMFECCCLFQSSVDKKIAKESDQNAMTQLIK